MIHLIREGGIISEHIGVFGFFHYMYCIGLNVHADSLLGSNVIRSLYHPLEALYINYYLIVYTLEGNRRYGSNQHTLIYWDNIYVLGTNYYVNRLVLTKALVKTLEGVTRKTYGEIVQHNAVYNIGFSDKVGYKRVFRLVVDIGGGSDLLYLSIGHYDDGIRHRQSLLLIVGNVYEGYSRFCLYVFKLYLHILSELEVKRSQGLVKKKHLRLIYKSSCYGHTLLLSA